MFQPCPPLHLTAILALALCAAPLVRAETPRNQAPPVGQSGGGDGSAKSPTIVIEEGATANEPAPPTPVGEEKREIGERIRENTSAIQECYARRLEERPTLQGRLMARFDIGPSGKVIGATAEGIADKELITCILKVIRKIEFNKPASGGKLRVAYPWSLVPEPRK